MVVRECVKPSANHVTGIHHVTVVMACNDTVLPRSYSDKQMVSCAVLGSCTASHVHLATSQQTAVLKGSIIILFFLLYEMFYCQIYWAIKPFYLKNIHLVTNF